MKQGTFAASMACGAALFALQERDAILQSRGGRHFMEITDEEQAQYLSERAESRLNEDNVRACCHMFPFCCYMLPVLATWVDLLFTATQAYGVTSACILPTGLVTCYFLAASPASKMTSFLTKDVHILTLIPLNRSHVQEGMSALQISMF